MKKKTGIAYTDHYSYEVHWYEIDGKVYEVVEIDRKIGALRIIDDSEEDYLYSPSRPKSLCAREPYGRFEVVEDDEKGTLQKAINGIID